MTEYNDTGRYRGPVRGSGREVPAEGELARKRNTGDPRGLGDAVAWLLEKLGLKKKPGCGCNRRQDNLNRLSSYLLEGIRKVFAWLRLTN